MESALDISVTPASAPVSEDRLAEILESPGFGVHFTDHMFTAEWTPEKRAEVADVLRQLARELVPDGRHVLEGSSRG